MSFVAKIPLQKKIAELESRIVALELSIAKLEAPVKPGERTHVSTRYASVYDKNLFGEDWDKMWEHFHRMMKKVFHSQEKETLK